MGREIVKERFEWKFFTRSYRKLTALYEKAPDEPIDDPDLQPAG